jgi:dipeptidyl aminopeptidase/acylaminoacyl peptidase
MKVFCRSMILWAVLVVTLCAYATDIDKILNYRTLGDVRLSPDGHRAVFVATVADMDENLLNSDLWVADLETNRSFQLTRSPKRDFAPRWAPDGKKLAFLSDRGGKTNIWLIAPDGGEAEPATKFEKLSLSGFEWLPDGSGFVFLAPDPPSDAEEKRKKEKNDPILIDRDFKFGRLYRWKFGDKEPVKLTTADYHVSSFDVSRDGQWIVFAAQATPKVPDFMTSDIRLLDLADNSVRDLVVRPGNDQSPRFAPTGQWVAFLSSGDRDDWIGNSMLWLVRPDGAGLRNLSESFDEDLGTSYRWSPDGQSIFFLADQGVSTRIFRINVSSARFEAATDYDNWKVVNSFDLGAKAQTAVLTLSDPETPAEVYWLDFGARKLAKLTSVNADFVGTAPTTELVRYRSPDGLDLQGLLIKPKGFEAGKRHPLLVIVHGGPAGVFDNAFTPRRGAYPIHAFTDAGYVLWLPNPRGSGGYGEKFRQANVRDWGGGDYRDILQGVDLLIERGLADPERMGVMGWSYGGYMTSWIVSQTARFQAASMGAGLSNLVSMYGTTDIPPFQEVYFESPPWENLDLYLAHSAIRFVGQAKTPTLIQHGQEDRRVPLSQGEEFYLALKKVGVPVEMVVYPRQPHGIQEPKLIRDAMQRNLNWFNKWLLGLEPSPPKKEEKKTD